MFIDMLKGKIHRATVVQAELDYVGSITIDQELLDSSGILEYEKVQIVDVDNGSRFETYAIASAIIGGTSFFGGKGRIFSVVIGGLIIGTINNGLNILQVQTYYQLVVMGGLIIAAVALDRLISK